MTKLLAFLLALPLVAATNRTVTVKSSGGDYTSLAAAVAGESKDLVSLDRQLTIECYAMQDTTAVVFDRTAWTTDATRYILVTVPASERHAGIYSTSKYRIEVANASAIQIHHGVFITVEWVQLHVSAGSNRILYFGGATNSASNITIRNNIIKAASGLSYNGAMHGSYTGSASANIYIYNNLIFNGTSTSAYAFQTEISGNYYLWNNTVVNMYGGFNRNGSGNVLAKNNLLSVTTTAATGTFAAGTNNNATNRSSMGYTVTGGGNTGDRVSQTFTFVDSGLGDYHLAGTDAGARDYGASDPSSGVFSSDIDGQTRGASWDIGFDEFVTPGAYGYKRALTIDYTKVGTATLTDFPVLFSGTYSWLATTANGGRVQNSNGYDIAFFSDSDLTTQLKHEVVSWAPTTGTVEMWVKVPSVSHTANTVIYIAYGNSTIASSQADRANTWDSSFLGVWHFADGTTLNTTNSITANAGTIAGTPVAGAGKIDGAMAIDSTGDYLNVGNSSAFDFTTGSFTVEAWIYPPASGQNTWQVFFKRGDYNADGWYFQTDASISRNGLAFATNQSGMSQSTGTGAGALTLSAWNHVAAVRSGTSVRIYVNGVDRTASAGSHGNPTSNSKNLEIGTWLNGMDEARISNTNRPVSYLVASYNNQNSPATFYAVGDETAAGGGARRRVVVIGD